MPNPKRRHSKRRTSTRRAHDHLKKPALATCPDSGMAMMPHRVSPHTGKYKGREVVEIEEA
ncbi:MAG: 50S ribosomal protein L32 [Acidobacteria bacterium]|nr:50S ribosomal protein L32 [Acidobacteriota bacterium]